MTLEMSQLRCGVVIETFEDFEHIEDFDHFEDFDLILARPISSYNNTGKHG